MNHPWLIAPVLLLATVRLSGADGDRTVVALHLNRNLPAWSYKAIGFGAPNDSKVIAEPGTTREGKVAGVAVRATRSPDEPGKYILQLQSGEGEAVSAAVTASAPTRVEIRRRAGLLPYRIALNPNAGPNGSPWELMTWTPDYRAEGTLAIGGCRALIAVWDMTADGIFDRRDFRQGTAAGIDLNGDGKIAGQGEFVYAGEVFEFCGRRFFVDPDSLSPDGSAVTVVETSLEKPRLGAPVPTLLMEATDGATLRSAEWRGKEVVLDFWASWCGYCIEGFATLRKMQDEFGTNLQVVSINTDEPSGISAARKVVASHDMPWPKVISGKGLNDPVWMMFERLEHSLPLYVLIDREGIVRYSGSGGENLAELRGAIEKDAPKP